MRRKKYGFGFVALLMAAVVLLSQFAFAVGSSSMDDEKPAQTMSEPAESDPSEEDEAGPPEDSIVTPAPQPDEEEEPTPEKSDNRLDEADEEKSEAPQEEPSTDEEDTSQPEETMASNGIMPFSMDKLVEFRTSVGGTLLADESVISGNKISSSTFQKARNNLTLTSNQTFEKWVCKGVEVPPDFIVTENMTITPSIITTRDPVIVTFYSKYGSTAAGDKLANGTFKVPYGKKLRDVYNQNENPGKIPDAPAHAGGGTLHWVTSYSKNNENLISFWEFSDADTLYRNTSVYPIWVHKIDFNPGTYNGTHGSVSPSSAYVLAGEEFTLPTPTCAPSVTAQNGAGFEYEVPLKYDWKIDGGASVGTDKYKPTGNTILVAEWKADTSGGSTNVTFKTSNLSGTDGDITVFDVAIGANVKNFPEVRETGKTVKGWKDQDSVVYRVKSDGTPLDVCKVKADMKLEPQLEVNTLTVQFKVDGEIDTDLTKSIKYGEKITQPNVPPLEIPLADGTKVSCPVIYWGVESDGLAKWNFSQPVENNMTLVAVRSQGGSGGGGGGGDPIKIYKVSFDPRNNGRTFVRNAIGDQLIEKPTPDPSKAKCTFRFWSEDPKNDGDDAVEFDFASTPITKDTKLYAVWDANADVEFNSDGGSYISVKTLPYGETVSEPAPPTKVGYTFLGWSTTRQGDKNPEDFVPFDFFTPITKELMTETGSRNNCLVLWAWYDCATKVIFHYRNGTGADGSMGELVEEVLIREGDSLSIPYRTPRDPDDPDAPRVIPEGKAFLDWMDSRGNQVFPGSPIKVGETVELFAKWQAGFKIIYVTGPTDNNYTQDTSYTYKVVSYPLDKVPITPPAMYKDSKFIGKDSWYRNIELDKNSGTHVDFDTIASEMVDNIQTRTQMHVYGKWSTETYPCTVTFHPQGGKLNGDTKEVKVENITSGTVITGPTPEGMNGAVFGGWYTEDYYENQVDLRAPIVQDMDLYARWVYKVNYDAGHGENPEQELVQVGGFVTPPPTPNVPGYVFAGWKKDDGTVWNFWEDTVDGPLTLYGAWNVTVSFDARGGSNEPAEMTIPENSDIEEPLPQPYLDEDHKFLGWYTDLEEGELFQFADRAAGTPGKKVAESITLYARYKGWEEAGAHKLNLQIQKGGQLVNQVRKYYNAGDLVEIELRVLDGYTFLGWLPPNAGNISDVNSLKITFLMPDKNATIVAQFQKTKKNQPVSSNTGVGGGGGGQSGRRMLNAPSSGGTLNTPAAQPDTAAPAATYRVNGSGRIGVSRMAELIERNATEDVVLRGENFTFRFAQGTMRQVPGKDAYAFGASFTVEDRAAIESAAGDALALTVHYDYSGELPAEAEITINVGKEYAGQTLYYYYFNSETGALEFVQNAQVDGQGRVTIHQTHCSDYAFLTVNLYDENGNDDEVSRQNRKETGTDTGTALRGAVRQNAGRDQAAQTTGAGARKLPDAGQRSPLALLALGMAALASSLVCLRKFREETEKEEAQ